MATKQIDIYELKKTLLDRLTAIDTVIAMLEGKESVTSAPLKTEEPEPGEEIDKEKQRQDILQFADRYFYESKNKPTTVKELTKLMMADGIKISGPQPGTTVGAYLLRTGKFKVENGKWSLKEYAA